jgi:hypothetical protein
MAHNESIRFVLKLVAIFGIVLSVFWENVFDPTAPTTSSSSSAASCPFHSNPLAAALTGLPDAPESLLYRNVQEPCVSCLNVEGEVYDLGASRILFPAPSTLSVEDLVAMLGASSEGSPHALDATWKLFRAKFPKVIKEARYSS